MGRSIGVLGTRHEPLDLDFTYFDGVTIRVHPYASDTVELDFLEAGKGVDLEALQSIDIEELDEEEAREKLAGQLNTLNRVVITGYRLVKDSLRAVIHPDDFDAYWKLAKDNGQRIRDLMADLKRITASVVEAESGFPTTPPSASQPGPASTPVRSADGSSSAVAPGSSDTDRALVLLRGRPDLQEFVVMAEETEQAKAVQKTAEAAGPPQTAAQRLIASTSG